MSFIKLTQIWPKTNNSQLKMINKCLTFLRSPKQEKYEVVNTTWNAIQDSIIKVKENLTELKITNSKLEKIDEVLC